MNRPSSRHLTHDYEAYKGLSLRELFWIVVITTPLTSLLFTIAGFILSFPLAFACVGFLLGFVLAITVCPKQVAKVKAGKPKGYLTKKMIVHLSNWGLRHSPYLHHQGPWQRAKRVRSVNV
jgi:conjugative transfer region protein (TIGR03750 family)